MSGLTKTQFKTISEIFTDIAQISLITMVTPFLIPELDRRAAPMLVSGLALTLIFWILSVWIAKGAEP